MVQFLSSELTWQDNATTAEWDYYLSLYQGHPLQSAHWGNAKQSASYIKDQRWIARYNGQIVLMARLEERRFLKLFKIAWIPKGPIIQHELHEAALYHAFLKRLRQKNFMVCAANPCNKMVTNGKSDALFYTIWIDLTLPSDTLWSNLHKQCRYDIRRAKKLGVTVEETTSLQDLTVFNTICQSISQSKGFNLGNSAQLMQQLFSGHTDFVKSHLFVARHENKICGGAFIIRSGTSLHYIWGAVDRQFSHLCIGEILQWAIIEWGISQQCTRYDLEGISTSNGGVDRFKKKFGGAVVSFPPIRIKPLVIGSAIVSLLIQAYILTQTKISKYKNTLAHYFKT